MSIGTACRAPRGPLFAIGCALAIAVSTSVAPAAPPQAPGASGGPLRTYIGNDDHTDYMWSGTDLQYRTAFLNMLDYYMSQAEQTATNPVHARGRFSCDGSVWLWEYERHRSAAAFQRLIDHLRAGNITMPLQTAVTVPGSMPAEAVLRSMYYAGRLERRYDLRFPMAVAMENQTLPAGIASLWAGAGARYSWRGICHCATRIDAANRPREIYHFVGPDGASVCMKWNSNESGPAHLGGYAEARNPNTIVRFIDEDADFRGRWPWSVAAAFGYGGDDLQTTTRAFVDAALAETNATREVWVSNQVDFFEDFLSRHAAEIPSFSGSFGNEWDLYTASMGELTADFKRQVEKLRTAEALATVASILDPTFMNGRTSDRDSAFLACGLYYEHDWTADGPISKAARAAWQRSMRLTLARYVDDLHDDALAVVAAGVQNANDGERHLVFNPLSWTRTDVVDLTTSVPPPRRVVDVSSGVEVPSQAIVVGGAPKLRILASSVPSVGFRIYAVRPEAPRAFPPSATVTLPSFDNGRYAVRLAPNGSITSWIDHADGNRELVDAANGAVHDLGAGTGTISVESAGPVSTTLHVSPSGSPRHETRVTLYAGIDRVDIEGLVTENFSGNVAYRSAFALPGAVMRHEEVGMIAKVARAAQGGDYADHNTRTDYLTFNHFVDLSVPGRGVTMSNWDSQFFAAGRSTITTLEASPIVKAVVGMQVDGLGLGILNQGGDTFFRNRYALRAHGPYDQAAAMRMALEHQNPLVTAPVTGGTSAPWHATTWSLLGIDSPDVLLWALKPAEEGIGNGIIARLWNLADAPRMMSLTMPPVGITSAHRTTHIETDLKPQHVTLNELTTILQRQQMVTFRLRGYGILDVPTAGAEREPLRIAPNPARAGATVMCTLPRAGSVRVAVHDVRGGLVRLLRDGASPAGRLALTWDGHDAQGRPASPGVYLVRVEAPGFTGQAKLVLVK